MGVNEALAHRLWTEQDPVGRTLMVGGTSFEVVGIAHYEGLRAGGDTAHPYLFSSDPARRDHTSRSLLVRALGARASAVVTLVLREGLRLAVIGVPLGLAASVASVRLLANYLYGVSATDGATFSGIALLMAGVALFACYVPARRAMRVDPVQALRRE